jgi:hypothetical protein
LFYEKTLNLKKEDKIPCNVDSEWLEKFRDKFLSKKQKTNKNQE